MIAIEKLRFLDGLIPAIIQDSNTNQVLMLGYMTQETLAESIQIGKVVFWSRSRKSRWLKGETSGNYLELVSMSSDCDYDAILVQARPKGPTCHTGSTSCFESHHE